jgi:endonuclease VIII
VPEGDTIFRTARTLGRALVGRTVTRFETVLPKLARVDDDTPIAGSAVESVRAQGKWLLIEFSGGLTLLTHMLMSGSWHIYRPGERWQRGREHMRIAIETGAFVAVAFDVPVAEFHTAGSLARRRGLSRLGPDVLAGGFDRDLAMANLRSRPELEIGPALLAQSLIAGLGNVFKSEVCFASGVDPFRAVGSLDDAALRRIVETAERFLRANAAEATKYRRTTGRADREENLWVYGRAGQPCRKCGEPVGSRKHACDARVSFWCARCQR